MALINLCSIGRGVAVTIKIGSRSIGTGHLTFLIAEVGSNHCQDLSIARRSIEAAVEAGADAVKFQSFNAARLYSKYTPRFSYLEAAGDQRETQDIIKGCELPAEWQSELKEYTESLGAIWLSTPTDRQAVDELDALGVSAYKISSFEAMDLPFVRYVASKGKPLIISTGMCTQAEINRIVTTCWDVGNQNMVLLQCTSLYPAPYRLCNLKAIDEMRKLAEVGYSDHTLGIHIPVAAVALGASVIEKHFTIDRNLPGPDHAHSLEPLEFAEMVRQIWDVESALGDGQKRGPAPEEIEMYQKARRSVVATCGIPAGTVITPEMVTTKRPGYGIPARDLEKVYGCVAKQDIREDAVMKWEMVLR